MKNQQPLAYELIRALGGPTTTWRFVRTNVNGKYFRYQIQVERGGSSLIENINGTVATSSCVSIFANVLSTCPCMCVCVCDIDVQNERCIDHPYETVGDLYKAQGFGGYECTYG